MSFWIRCNGYFSTRPHPGPFWIGIADGRITAIRNKAPEEVDATVVESEESYLIPLLSDTHVHCYMNPWPLNPKERVRPGSGEFEDEVQAGLQRLRTSLSQGLGFVRDMGDPFGINLEIKRRIAKEPLNYPAIQVPGPAIHRPKKYGRFLGVKRETLPEILILIDELANQEQVDFIKVVTTGIVDFAKQCMNQEPQFTVEELDAVVKRAAHHGLRVASHCSGDDGLDINLAAGVQFIEHAYFIRPDQLELMMQKGVHWTPTFAPVYQQAINPECGWDTDALHSMDEILSQHNHSLGKGHAQGVKVLAGTDAGSPGVAIGDGLSIELRNMARSLSNETVLGMATAVNADACQHPEYTGRIEVGHPASFATYAKAPWLELDQLPKPINIYYHGSTVKKGPNASD